MGFSSNNLGSISIYVAKMTFLFHKLIISIKRISFAKYYLVKLRAYSTHLLHDSHSFGIEFLNFFLSIPSFYAHVLLILLRFTHKKPSGTNFCTNFSIVNVFLCCPLYMLYITVKCIAIFKPFISYLVN